MRALIALLAGCGGGGGALTCELLADSSNCWAEAAVAFDACLPQATGALSADRKTCTFSDGARVVFDTPLPMTTGDVDTLGLTVFSSNDAECGRFVDTAMNRIELTAGGDTVVAELHDGQDFHLHCAAGDFTTSFDTLFTCQAPSVLPVEGLMVTPTMVSFSIFSVTTTTELFRCEI